MLERCWRARVLETFQVVEGAMNGHLSFRFRILQRDNFTCQYCGRKAPAVVLEVDHVVPRANGGSGRATNLITACHELSLQA